jgi:uncharacterized SAM-binding protein YcdF (DUF218 family)
VRAWLLVVAVAAAVVLGLAALRGAGRFLVVEDPLPSRADAIVVLAGSVPDRAIEGAALYRDGAAPRVVVTRERRGQGEAALRRLGVELPESDALLVLSLTHLGVPRDAIVVLRRRTNSTETEARTIARWACAHHVRSLVVVTSKPHTRRARMILRQTLGPRIALAVRPSRWDTYSAARWWYVRRHAKAVLSEWQKLANYWLVARWRIEPCGGLRPAVRAAAPRQAATACFSSGASSPRSCIWRTMSQPPMNFPAT